MDSRSITASLLATLMLILAGCSKVRTFDGRGVIEKLSSDKHTARIKHKEIPDYMPAMTMDFNVRDPKELDGLAAGDTVTFRLNVTEDTHWIDHISKVAAEAVTTTATNPPTGQAARWRLVPEAEPLDVGNPMPNYDFTNELGQAVSLKDMKGQAYAFTFIFTRCPLPDFCPRMSSNFQKVQETLETMPDAPKNWRLFSITMDPEFDTPLVLKTYAARFKQDNKRWNFLTAPVVDITSIGERFGLEIFRSEGTLTHNMRTVVIDAEGKVQNIIIGNSWKPDEVVEDLLKAARKSSDDQSTTKPEA